MSACPQCEPDPVPHVIDLSDDSDDSNYKSDLWEDKIIVLPPQQKWDKPSGKALYVTQVSMTIPPTGSEGTFGILNAVMAEGLYAISKIFPHQPNQPLNLAWSQNQEVSFINSGNRPISVALLVKCD